MTRIKLKLVYTNDKSLTKQPLSTFSFYTTRFSFKTTGNHLVGLQCILGWGGLRRIHQTWGRICGPQLEETLIWHSDVIGLQRMQTLNLDTAQVCLGLSNKTIQSVISRHFESLPRWWYRDAYIIWKDLKIYKRIFGIYKLYSITNWYFTQCPTTFLWNLGCI